MLWDESLEYRFLGNSATFVRTIPALIGIASITTSRDCAVIIIAQGQALPMRGKQKKV